MLFVYETVTTLFLEHKDGKYDLNTIGKAA